MPAPVQNYAKEMERIVAGFQEWERPRLLLHACCAPCASGTLEYLCRHFAVTLLYYNPNIAPYAEYEKRRAELERLLGEMPLEGEPSLLDCGYDGGAFQAIAQGLEEEPEGGTRCMKCYRLRLEETAKLAALHGFDFFTTTLSISPLKNARALNAIGGELAQKYGVRHLPADFKKKDGYKRSIERSREYGLYRQDYCGCVYSKRERQRAASEAGKVTGDNSVKNTKGTMPGTRPHTFMAFCANSVSHGD